MPLSSMGLHFIRYIELCAHEIKRCIIEADLHRENGRDPPPRQQRRTTEELLEVLHIIRRAAQLATVRLSGDDTINRIGQHDEWVALNGNLL
jgi:hypothetical protein